MQEQFSSFGAVRRLERWIRIEICRASRVVAGLQLEVQNDANPLNQRQGLLSIKEYDLKGCTVAHGRPYCSASGDEALLLVTRMTTNGSSIN